MSTIEVLGVETSSLVVIVGIVGVKELSNVVLTSAIVNFEVVVVSARSNLKSSLFIFVKHKTKQIKDTTQSMEERKELLSLFGRSITALTVFYAKELCQLPLNLFRIEESTSGKLCGGGGGSERGIISMLSSGLDRFVGICIGICKT